MSALYDYQAGGEAAYTGSYVDSMASWGASQADLNEWAKIEAYSPAPARGYEDQSPWTRLVQFGISRVIDNTLPAQNTGIQGNVQPGSFAGQNGRTYNQVGGVNAPPTLAGFVASVQSMNPLMLAAIGVVAYLALKK